MLELRIFGIIIGLIALFMNNLNYKRNILYLPEFILWLIIWIIFILLCITPNSFNIILSTFNLDHTFHLIIILAFIVVYSICYKTYIDNKLIQRKMELLIRELALNENKID